jgi:hypothetical protein
LQSASDEGRLKFRDHLDTEGHTSHSQILPKDVISLEGKKILVRPSQAETTKGKNVIVGESREKVGPTTKKLNPTFDEPSAKYNEGNGHTKSRQNWNVHADMFFRLCTCFSGNLVEFHLRNKKVLQTIRI